ncbi:MAG: hypothetical protein ACRDP7_41840 [Trebonia sp.]
MNIVRCDPLEDACARCTGAGAHQGTNPFRDGNRAESIIAAPGKRDVLQDLRTAPGKENQPPKRAIVLHFSTVYLNITRSLTLVLICAIIDAWLALRVGGTKAGRDDSKNQVGR